MTPSSSGAALVLLIVSGLATLRAADWPQWRGPARTAVLSVAEAPAAWPASLTRGWSTEVGEGYSSPVLAGDRIFVHARRDPDEIVLALDAATGRVVWRQSYPAPVDKNPYAKGMAKGPYSTPLVANGRVFSLGTTGILSAWNVATGELLWRKAPPSPIDMSKLFCGTAMSPVLTKAGVVIQVGDDRGGRVAAYDPASGKEVWSKAMDGPGYASPIELQMLGTSQLVTMTTRAVVGLAADTGVLLWEFPFPDEWNENIVTPVATASGVIVSGVRQGTRLLTPAKKGETWTVTQAWHTPDVTMYMSSPVLVNGTLYGHSSKRRGQFVAISAADGKLLWGSDGRAGASASVMAAGRHLVFLSSESELVIAEADPAAYKELRRYNVSASATYAHPVLTKDRLLVRDMTHVTAWGIGGR